MNRYYPLLRIFPMLSAGFLHAQDLIPMHPTMQALGNMRSTYPAASFNPAHRASIEHASVSLFHNNHFIRSGLSQNGIEWINPLAGHFGSLAMTYTGLHGYREISLLGSWAIPVEARSQVGAGLGFLWITQGDVASHWRPIYRLGTNWQATKILAFSMLLEGTWSIPSISTGWRYSPNEKVNLMVEMYYSPGKKISFNVGMDYALHPSWFIRSGISAPEGNMSFGAQFSRKKSANISLFWAQHPYLGSSTGISLTVLVNRSSHAPAYSIRHPI